MIDQPSLLTTINPYKPKQHVCADQPAAPMVDIVRPRYDGVDARRCCRLPGLTPQRLRRKELRVDALGG